MKRTITSIAVAIILTSLAACGGDGSGGGATSDTTGTTTTDTPPAVTPPAVTPPAVTPPAVTPPAVTPPATDPAVIQANKALFRQTIDVLKANYFYTAQEGIDWEAVYTANLEDFATVSAVGAKIFSIMEPLKNEHFYVSPGGGSMLGGQQSNYKTVAELAGYFTTAAQSVGGGTIKYALTTNNVVYVNIASFPSASIVGVAQAQVNAIFDAFPGAAGMVIDIRSNYGGQDDIANMFGINLINHDVLYANYDMDYNGSADPAKVGDDGIRFYNKPVALLVGPQTFSQAELFTRFMKVAGYKIVGSPEYGK